MYVHSVLLFTLNYLQNKAISSNQSFPICSNNCSKIIPDTINYFPKVSQIVHVHDSLTTNLRYCTVIPNFPIKRGWSSFEKSKQDLHWKRKKGRVNLQKQCVKKTVQFSQLTYLQYPGLAVTNYQLWLKWETKRNKIFCMSKADFESFFSPVETINIPGTLHITGIQCTANSYFTSLWNWHWMSG